MRILKIVIQNIYSLKCEKPIEIDFESEKFKDVGLFAIIGSTGSGKTTILDAITIALYNKVPRLTKSKAGILDIVSKGADNAYVAVVFENKKIKYEASWTLKRKNTRDGRLDFNKDGKLSNLSTGKIIAEKSKVPEKVKETIQLDFDQFLRSVLLAQGDFASFLSAPEKDKGILLEKITGTSIYKKIGEDIHHKKSIEEKNIENIKKEINDIDILSEEDIEVLKLEKLEISTNLNNLKKEQKENEFIEKWYKQYTEINEKLTDLITNEEKLISEKQKAKNDLEKFELHKKAEPFKGIIKENLRLEKEIDSKERLLKELKDNLENLNSKIEIKTKEKDNLKAVYIADEDNFNNWLPKFDKLTKLDEKISFEKKSNEELDKKINEFNKKRNFQKQEKIDFEKSLSIAKEELQEIEDFLKQNKYSKEIEQNFTKWNNELIALSNNLINTDEEKSKLHKAEVEKKTATEKLKKLQKNEIAINDTWFQKNNSLDELEDYLKKNDLVKVQEQKEKLKSEGLNWNSLKTISEEYSKKSIQKDELESKLKKLETLIDEVLKKISSLEKEVKNAKKSYEDYYTIHQQNIKIKSFEEERQFLQKGDACKLCGSTEHPLIENYKEIKISDSESELKIRKEKFELLNNDLQTKRIELTKNTSQKDSINIETLISELENIKNKAKNIFPDFNLKDKKQIDENLLLAREHYKIFIKEIEDIQSKNNEKENLLKDISKIKDDVNNFKNELSVLEEKLKNIEINIDVFQKNISETQKEIVQAKNQLTKELEKYQISFPALEKISSFIADLKTGIKNYTQKNKAKESLQSKILLIEKDLENLEKVLQENIKSNKQLFSKISEIKESIRKNIKERSKILDLTITVTDKRNLLTEKLKESKTNFEKINKKIVELNSQKQKFETEANTYNNDLKKHRKHIKKLEEDLTDKLKESNFSNKWEVIKALLKDEEFIKIEALKDKLNTKTIELKTLKTTLSQSKETLNKQKTFETSHQEILEIISNNNAKIESELIRKIEIAERFKFHNEIMSRNEKVFSRIKKQEKILYKWQRLIEVIGKNKDSLSKYVQRLTLEYLITLANIHLEKLNKRYSLKIYEDKSLNFKLIDHFLAEEERDVDTSSGGEKFLISLALALGLSDLASENVQIESLFIDEGFGTLDSETLETVIYALETLQTQGKMIGIISHVESLKERIPTQIKVVKKNNGVSIIEL